MLITVVEGVAVILALAYLWLAARENIWCWYCAFASSALYVPVMWNARLLGEVWLQLFYMAMAVAGWYQWRHGRRGPDEVLKIVRLQWWQHAALIALIMVLTTINGYVLQTWFTAALPFVDSFIVWGSVITTVLVIRKVLENWLYWIVIDSTAVFAYFNRGLNQTAMLFAIYVVIVIFGYLRWRKEYLKDAGPRPSPG